MQGKLRNIKLIKWIVFGCSLLSAGLCYFDGLWLYLFNCIQIFASLLICLWLYQITEEKRIWQFFAAILVVVLIGVSLVALMIAMQIKHFICTLVLLCAIEYLVVSFLIYRLGKIVARITGEKILALGIGFYVLGMALQIVGDLMLFVSDWAGYLLMSGVVCYIVASLLTAIAFARVNFETLQKHKEG